MALSREAVGWGLLFGVPPGVAAAVFVAGVKGSSPGVGVAFGAALALALFALVVVGARGSETP